MGEEGLWKLFFLTGLPEVYLALRGERKEAALRWEELARTAFVTRPAQKTEC